MSVGGGTALRQERETFRTSRLADFCTEAGLVADTGHPTHQWPSVVFKELTDNAIDICEEFGIAPVIEIVVAIPNSSQMSIRSEEHTSELQSLTNLGCRLLLEKKKYVLDSDAHIE